jgi:RNA recognition motif-containing protein
MRLYVGNLSFNTTENDLEDAFARFGTVAEVKIMQDMNTGRSRGFGFVTMGSAAEGEAAIRGLEGSDLDGRKLTVNEARPREERGGGGGGFRSGGGGGGHRGGGGGGGRGGYSGSRRY